MLFNSVEFLFFLPVVFGIYWLVLRKRESRNLFLLAASYVFYGWWDVTFLFLIFLTSVSSFFSGLYIGRSTGETGKRIMLWSNVVLNIGILCVYKYFNFFSSGFASLMSAVGWEVDAVTLQLILPVGISFYTFQALSYVIDVKRGHIGATTDFISFMAFISFFPQLVAGPIERATNLLPQFLSQRVFNYEKAVAGMRLILWGLFKKMVVADNCAPVVDSIFGNFADAGTVNLWVGAFLFTIQIYCDFSGYSDIAVGVARLFSIDLMRNFQLPYFSKDINEFWKRWHISLTSWFRDYIYIPLGGNRQGKWKRVRNTVIVFLTSGLWHGANYTFIVWGGYHALLYIPSVFRSKKKVASTANSTPGVIKPVMMMGFTFMLVMIGWIIFRASTISEACDYIRLMFTPVHANVIEGKRAICWSLIMLAGEWAGRKYESPVDLFSRGIGRNTSVRWGLYVALFLVELLLSGTAEQFIYFQF